MHRQAVLSLLNAYAAWDVSDQQQKQRIIDFVEQNPNCFERSLRIGHITGSAWVVSRDGKRVLLTHHKKLDRWMQLGGHADGESDVACVAMREAQEESGLEDLTFVSRQIFDVDVHEIPARGPEPAHFHYDIRFAIQITGTDNFQVSDESHELAWVGIEQLASYANERSVLRMGEKWLKANF